MKKLAHMHGRVRQAYRTRNRSGQSLGRRGDVVLALAWDLKDVRNRDAHSYRKNVRDADFPLVEEDFVPAFNILVKAMRHGGHPAAKF